MNLRNNVDLGKSFEALKNKLANTSNTNDPEAMSYQIGYLKSAIRTHLAECIDADDLPKGLFQQHENIKDHEGQLGCPC